MKTARALSPDPDDGDTLFFDVIFLALAGFVVVTVLLLLHLNPPLDDEQDTRAPGSVIFELRWPDESRADVDLWVMGPDGAAVGYSNRESELSNLLRDDLGFTHDLSNLNYENAYTRGIMAGEYQANVHLFSEHGSPPPIPVWLIVSVKRENGVTLRLVETEATLTHHGQEITAVRFGLTDEGRLVAGSIHAVPRPLRGRR